MKDELARIRAGLGDRLRILAHHYQNDSIVRHTPVDG